MAKRRRRTSASLIAGIVLAGFLIPAGYMLAQLRPVELLVTHGNSELLAFIELALSYLFCLVLAALAIGLFFLLRLKDRLVQKEVAEIHAREMAKHDPLTGLPNRRKLEDSFRSMMKSVGPNQFRAIMMLDMNGFKPINDVYGHAVGDQLLKAFARRLIAIVGDDGMVARFGGDEFAILSPVLASRDEAADLAQKILATIVDPFNLDAREIRVGSGIGIAMFPSDGFSSAELLRRADIALYQAKASDASRYCMFEMEMDATILQRSLLEERLRRAITRNDIVPHFLPIIRYKDEKIIGFEALARWYDTEYGYVPPNQFIPIAEECGLVSQLTDQILKKACEAASAWPKDIDLSLNVSALKLQESDFPDKVKRILAETRFPARRLVLDVTEGALTRYSKSVAPNLKQLTSAGVRIALDDFGGGRSSLTHLRDFPIDTVKIDYNFSSGLLNDKECSALIEAILVLAKGLQLKVIAEGVETETLAKRLKDLGCFGAQGYHFGQPVVAEATQELLEDNGVVRKDREFEALSAAG